MFRYLVICLVLIATSAIAQSTITAPEQEQVVRAVIDRFQQTYIFPEVARKVRAQLEERLRRGTYRAAATPVAFAEAVTRDLREITGDQHPQVRYSAEPFAPMNEVDRTPTAEEREQTRAKLATVNYGVLKAERMPGNIGFLDLDFLADPEFAGETMAAAMTTLANTDALIIDLRYNGGGSSRMVAFLASYLFEGDPVHLNDIEVPEEKLLKQSWTLPYVPGRRFGAKKPVVILTSSKTFSGAEELAYDLQALHRATVVGERTRGGAHPVGRYRISEHFAVLVPASRAVNPITKTNWEGTGVHPDVEVAAAGALKSAQLQILGQLAPSEERTKLKERLEKE